MCFHKEKKEYSSTLLTQLCVTQLVCLADIATCIHFHVFPYCAHAGFIEDFPAKNSIKLLHFCLKRTMSSKRGINKAFFETSEGQLNFKKYIHPRK